MDRDEQARKILSEDSGEWSEGARKLRLPLDNLPNHVRRAVAERVASAKMESTSAGGPSNVEPRTSAVPVWRKAAYAAAALVVFSLGAYFALPGLFTGGGPAVHPDFVRGRGDFSVKRDGKIFKPAPGATLAQGDELVLRKNADVLLKRDKLSLYLSGPAVLEIRPGGVKTTVLFLDRGTLAVRTDVVAAGSPPGTKQEHPLLGHPGLAILTRRARYYLAGTFARLNTSQKSERIVVLEGLFRVRGILSGRDARVPAGRALDVPADPGEKIPAARPLSDTERQNLNRVGENMQVLKTGKVVLNPSAFFSTDDEILNYYGILHQVELKDGQSYTGFAERESGRLRIHTTLGVVEIPASNFHSMKTIK